MARGNDGVVLTCGRWLAGWRVCGCVLSSVGGGAVSPHEEVCAHEVVRDKSVPLQGGTQTTAHLIPELQLQETPPTAHLLQHTLRLLQHHSPTPTAPLPLPHPTLSRHDTLHINTHTHQDTLQYITAILCLLSPKVNLTNQPIRLFSISFLYAVPFLCMLSVTRNSAL